MKISTRSVWFITCLNIQRMRVIGVLVERETLSSHEIAGNLDITESYARSLLSPLVLLDLVKKGAKTRKSKPLYTITPELREWYHATIRLCDGEDANAKEQIPSETDVRRRD